MITNTLFFAVMHWQSSEFQHLLEVINRTAGQVAT